MPEATLPWVTHRRWIVSKCFEDGNLQDLSSFKRFLRMALLPPCLLLTLFSAIRSRQNGVNSAFHSVAFG